MIGVMALIGLAVWAVVQATTRGTGVRTAPESSPTGGRERTRQVLDELAALRVPGTTVLITHQVNITALTGETLAMGELFLARRPAPGGQRLTVRARLSP